MKRIRNLLLTLAIAGMLTIGVGSMANAGVFGVPDFTLGSMTMSWFDISKSGTDDIIPVWLNASDVDLSSDPYLTPGRCVHFVLWTRASAKVFDKIITLSAWDMYSETIRDILSQLSTADRAKLEVAHATLGARYQGYWTATVIDLGMQAINGYTINTLPYNSDYPHFYQNVLTGWNYLLDIQGGRMDVFPMVTVESATLIARNVFHAYMLSYEADFWNRVWWWWSTANAAQTNDNTIAPWFSNRWNDSTGLFIDVAGFDDTKVYERFDARAGFSASLLTRGYGFAYEAGLPSFLNLVSQLQVSTGLTPVQIVPQIYCAENGNVGTCADAVEVSAAAVDAQASPPVPREQALNMYGRVFLDPSATGIEPPPSITNRLVIWCDVNGALPPNNPTPSRSMGVLVYDENENYISSTIDIPFELNVIDVITIVPTNKRVGFLTLSTARINSSNGHNHMDDFWTWFIEWVVPYGPMTFMPDRFVVSDWYPGTNANQLQILGWMTNEGLGADAATTWGAIFLMPRDYFIRGII